MTKIIVDTNVVVSSLISRSYPYRIVQSIFSDKNLVLCLSNEVLYEYKCVLARDKFARYPGFTVESEKLIANLYSFAKIYNPIIKLEIANDVDDNKFLELADISESDYLITGNINDFPMENYKTTTILTPKDFWDVYSLIR